MLTKKNISILVVLLVLIIDQIVKILIKTNLMLGEEINVFGNWFVIHFLENDGMAFGWDIPGNWGKIMLSLFRLVAVTGIAWYMISLIKQDAPKGLVISLSLILAGAIGNIIDSLFYGLIFNDSLYQVAEMFPEQGGYGKFLYGKVVDMFYFPIINSTYPNWFPIVGGKDFLFFRPVFNVADSAISIGVFMILIFQKRFFSGLSNAS